MSIKTTTCGKIYKTNKIWAVEISEVTCVAKTESGCQILAKTRVVSTVYARRKQDLIDYLKKHKYEQQENL